MSVGDKLRYNYHLNSTKQQHLCNHLYIALMITSTELKNEHFIVIVMDQCKMMEKRPEIAKNKQKLNIQ